MASTIDEEKTSVSFYFREKAKIKPKGFNDMSINDNITVIVKGKVNSISEDKSKWDPGKRFAMEIKSCEIVPEATKVSLDAAIKDAKKKV